jgi:hypothetical protein|eukprot:SAG25_NODE_615_length_6505_cov_8.659694_11_plen_107_part_00
MGALLSPKLNCRRAMPQIPRVNALLVLDGDGKRIAAKYHGEKYASSELQAEFEKKIFAKTKNSQARMEGKKKPLLTSDVQCSHNMRRGFGGWGRAYSFCALLLPCR